MAAFNAYFFEGKNLALQPVLLELAERCGLSTTKAADVLTNRSYREAVDIDWQDSQKLQITAVPTFLFQNDRMVGAQSYAALQGLMLQHGITRKN